MLVLSRKRGESIVIGDNIKITIIEHYHDSVRIGITAPIEVPIHRQEIQERIERERRERDGSE